MRQVERRPGMRVRLHLTRSAAGGQRSAAGLRGRQPRRQPLHTRPSPPPHDAWL